MRRNRELPLQPGEARIQLAPAGEPGTPEYRQFSLEPLAALLRAAGYTVIAPAAPAEKPNVLTAH